MEHLTGMRALAPDYDGFVVDLWGVVHNGVAVLPGVLDCLARLRAAGKRIVFLSNAPRRAGPVTDALRRMGVPDTAHDGVVTSGEVTRTTLIERADPFVAALGPRVFHLGPPKDANVLAGTGLDPVGLADADFVLNTGPDDEAPEGEDVWRPLLAAAAARHLPMICANPDIDVIRGNSRVPCAGYLAAIYETEHGGRVRRIGKPDPTVYRPVLAALAVDPARVLAVGDAIATDLRGAAAAGLASVWVLGGIHADLAADPGRAAKMAAEAGVAPRASLPGFVWDVTAG